MSVTRKRITPVSIAELPNRGNNNLPARPIEFERTPPQDLVAEQSVLGGMLLSKDAIADVAISIAQHTNLSTMPFSTSMAVEILQIL